MKHFFITIDRIETLNKLIKAQRTGTPDEISARLGLKRSAFYELLEELKAQGAPIAYSKAIGSYYYTRPYSIEISFRIIPLEDEAQEKIYAGSQIFAESGFYGRNSCNFATA